MLNTQCIISNLSTIDKANKSLILFEKSSIRIIFDIICKSCKLYNLLLYFKSNTAVSGENMLDIKQIRKNPKEIEKKLKTKIPEIELSSLIELDNIIRRIQTSNRNNRKQIIPRRKNDLRSPNLKRP